MHRRTNQQTKGPNHSRYQKKRKERFQNTQKRIKGQQSAKNRAQKDVTNVAVDRVIKYPPLIHIRSELESLANGPATDVWFDTSCMDLCPIQFRGKESLSQTYKDIFKFSRSGMYRDIRDRLSSDMSDLAKFHKEMQARPNVFLTRDVIEEFRIYLDKFMRVARDLPGFSRTGVRYLSPISRLQKTMNRAKQKIDRTGAEEDPLAEMIYSLIPEDVVPDRSRSEEPSETNKRLIAIPLARGFSTGRDQTIMTNDGGIAYALRAVGDYFLKHPERLEIEDLGFEARGFTGETRIIGMEEGRPRTINSGWFLGHEIARRLSQNSSAPSLRYSQPASEHSSIPN